MITRASRRSSRGEKRLQRGGALVRQDSAGELDAMVEGGVVEDLEAGTDSAALGVIAAVDYAQKPGLNDGAGAHDAGLDGGVQCGAEDAVIPHGLGCRAQRQDFGVRRGLAPQIVHPGRTDCGAMERPDDDCFVERIQPFRSLFEEALNGLRGFGPDSRRCRSGSR